MPADALKNLYRPDSFKPIPQALARSWILLAVMGFYWGIPPGNYTMIALRTPTGPTARLGGTLAGTAAGRA
jgi:hypothetical protein